MDVTLATELARQIRVQQQALDAELRRPQKERRAQKYRERQIGQVNGMLIGLSYIIGQPCNVPAAEDWMETALERPEQGCA